MTTKDCKNCYNETNNENGYCHDCNNRRAEDQQWSGCAQCGDTFDLMTLFTTSPICGRCTRKNHKKALYQA